MSIDDAFATPIMVLRASSFDLGEPRPRAALVVRFPGDHRLRESVIRGLLRRGWQLVAAPVGEFEPADEPRAAMYLPEGSLIRVETGRDILYEGPLRLHADTSGDTWTALAQGIGEVLVFVTVDDEPVNDEDDADRIARAGHLVGVAATLVAG